MKRKVCMVDIRNTSRTITGGKYWFSARIDASTHLVKSVDATPMGYLELAFELPEKIISPKTFQTPAEQGTQSCIPYSESPLIDLFSQKRRFEPYGVNALRRKMPEKPFNRSLFPRKYSLKNFQKLI